MDINNRREILEVTLKARGKGGYERPHIRSTTGETLQEISLDGFDLVGAGINNLGQIVVGTSTDTGLHVTLWSLNGDTVDVGHIPDASGDIQLSGVNDFGKVIGANFSPSGSMTSFVVSADIGCEDLQPRIGEPLIWAMDLNNSEDIVGACASKDLRSSRAFVWNATEGTTWLDSLRPYHQATVALGVNNHRQVVGISAMAGSIERFYHRLIVWVAYWFPSFELPSDRFHAFLWDEDKMYALDDLIPSESGWKLEFAWNINDLGQIVGEGQFQGQTHMFLLTPIDEAEDSGE